MEKQVENIYIKRISYFRMYVIKGVDGDILIDTGFICMKKKIKKWLDKFNIKLIILTHAHVDHIWNVNYIKKLYNCKVAISELDIDNINNKIIKPQPLSKKYFLWCNLMKLGMKIFKPQPFDVDIVLKDNQILEDYNIKVVSLSGHTNGSIGILYKDYLFAGDALVNRRKITLAYQNQNNKQAKQAYERIKQIHPKIIFLGHDKEIVNYYN